MKKIKFNFSCLYPMSLYYVFDCLGAAQVMERGKNILDEFKDELTSKDLTLIKKTWIRLSNKTRTMPYFNLKIFSESTSNTLKLEDLIIRTTKDSFLRENLPKVLVLVDKLLKPRFDNAGECLDASLIKKKIITVFAKTKTYDLLGQFRSFLGSYAERASSNIRVALVWQPEYSSSSAIKPNLVILGVSKNFNIWGLLSVLFHETLHLQYECFSGKVKLDLTASQPVKSAQAHSDFLMTFNEGLAYLWHYEYFEVECLKNEGRLKIGVKEKHRWNPHHLAFALKLKPLVDDYRERGKPLDKSFLKKMWPLYYGVIQPYRKRQ